MICTKEDEFVASLYEGHTRWIALLNDGRLVYQDDGRPGLDISAWMRLKDYCEQNEYYLTGMVLQFRTNTIHLPTNKDGYFFSKSSGAAWGGKTENFYVTGTIENNDIAIVKYRVPELIEHSKSFRNIEQCKYALIMKKKYG